MRKKYWSRLLAPKQSLQVLIARIIGIPFSKWLVNFVFQRIFRINSEVDFSVHFTSSIVLGRGIEIGSNVWKSFALSGGCYIQGGNKVIIGDETMFAPGVKIVSANHDPANLKGWVDGPPVQIGKRCWIGANSIILPGVVLGDDCIVGAGCVVTKGFPPGSVVMGNPAVRIGSSRGLMEARIGS